MIKFLELDKEKYKAIIEKIENCKIKITSQF